MMKSSRPTSNLTFNVVRVLVWDGFHRFRTRGDWKLYSEPLWGRQSTDVLKCWHRGTARQRAPASLCRRQSYHCQKYSLSWH